MAARVLVVIAALGVAVFCWLFFVPVGFTWPTEPFSVAAWSAAPPSERYKFARDLVERKQLIGKDRDAVIAALGRPESAAPDGTYMSYILRNTETKGAILPGIVVLDVRFSSGTVSELVVRPI